MTCFEPNRRESIPAAARGGFDRGLEMGMKLGREAERRFQAEFLAARPDLWKGDEVAEACQATCPDGAPHLTAAGVLPPGWGGAE